MTLTSPPGIVCTNQILVISAQPMSQNVDTSIALSWLMSLIRPSSWAFLNSLAYTAPSNTCLVLPSQTSVLLQADPTYSNTVEKAVSNARDAENENEAQRLEDTAMESLKAYYARYGFKGKGSSMQATLETVIGRCQSGGGLCSLRRKFKGSSLRFRRAKIRRSIRKKLK